MTQDEIYKMVRQSDLGFLLKDNWMMHHEFVAFANLVAAKATEEANAKANASWTLMCKKMVAIEREACAKVCEDYGRAEEMQAIGNDYAQAIRARRTSMTQEALKQLIEDLISMMEYHVEQTRPIHKTTVALQAAREALKALAQQAQEPVKWSDYEPDGVHHNKPEQEPVAWKLMPRDATDAMLKAMDECSTEGYDERLYAGHAASVYMAAWDEAPTPPQRTEQKPVAWRAPNWGHGDDEWVYRDFDDPVLIADGKPSPNNEALYTTPSQRTEQEPVCPDCKAKVLYECVACSSNNYPPKTEQEPVAWQPIETAPKETEIFIGRFIDGEFKFGRSEMFYEQANEFEGETFSGWVWSEDDCSSLIAENPTHWMALPEAPIEAAHGIKE